MQRLRWIAAILLLLVSLYIAYLNPDSVFFRLSSSHIYPVPIAVLLFLSLLMGAFLMVALNLAEEMRDAVVWLAEKFRRRKAGKMEKLYRKGINLLREGDREGATAVFEEVLEDVPCHLETLQKLGELYRKKGKVSEALQLHLKACLLAEDNSDILFQLAADYRAGGQFSEAIKILEDIRNGERASFLPLRELRSLYMEQGEWEQAYAVHRDLLHMFQEGKKPMLDERLTACLLYEIGNLLIGREEPKKAIVSYRKALKASREFVPAYMALGETYLKKGKDVDAIRCWEEGYETTLSPLLLKKLEEHFLSEEQPDRVVNLYRKALFQNPQDTRVCLMAGEAYLRLEILDEALEAFRRAEASFFSWGGFHIFLGSIQEKKGDIKAALEELKLAFEQQDFFSTPYLCEHCYHLVSEWSGRCNYCLRWGTLQLVLLEEAKGSTEKIFTTFGGCKGKDL